MSSALEAVYSVSPHASVVVALLLLVAGWFHYHVLSRGVTTAMPYLWVVAVQFSLYDWSRFPVFLPSVP